MSGNTDRVVEGRRTTDGQGGRDSGQMDSDPSPNGATRWLRSYSVVLIRLALLATDLASVLLAFILAYSFRKWLGEVSPQFTTLQRSVSFYANYWPVLLAWPVIFWREGLYPGLWLSSSEELKRLVQGATVASLLVLTLTFVTRTGEQFSRAVAIAWWGLSLSFLPAGRYLMKNLLGTSGAKGDRAVLLGAGKRGELVLNSLARQRLPVLNVVAVFDDDFSRQGSTLDGQQVVGPTGEAASWAAGRGVRTVIVAMPGLGREKLLDLIETLGASFHRVVLVPDLIGLSTAETVARDLEGIHTVELRRNLLLRRNRWLKRGIDLMVAVAAMFVLIPVELLIAAGILTEGGRPVLYSHSRIGFGGSNFEALKYRTMVANAEQVLERHFNENPEAREEWQRNHKLQRDPRITNVGAFLRRFSLDELPQLWNVLKGEMSLVGPRPIVEEEIPKYGGAIKLYYQVRPGLTGLWQVSGRSELDYEERVRLDTYYVRNWSVWLDMIIIARTFWAVLSGRGAY